MAEIFFNEQKNGYDKTQVDSYIKKLAEAYQTAYKEYLAVCDKYNNLMRDYKNLESDKQEKQEKQAETYSEKLAKEILNNAYNEEIKIAERAKKNLDHVYHIMETAINEAYRYLDSRSDEESGGIINENENENIRRIKQ